MNGPGASDDEATRRWREWSGTADTQTPAAGPDIPPWRPPAAPGPAQGSRRRPDQPSGRFTARTMGLAGSTLIASLAVVLISLAGYHGGPSSSPRDSSLEPVGAATGQVEGCAATTGNLLCHAKTRPFDPLPPVAAGPGSAFSEGAENLVDGNPATAWTITQLPTGTSVVMYFGEQVSVGTAGLYNGQLAGPAAGAQDPDPYLTHRRVLAVTWTFQTCRGLSAASRQCDPGRRCSRPSLTEFGACRRCRPDRGRATR